MGDQRHEWERDAASDRGAAIPCFRCALCGLQAWTRGENPTVREAAYEAANGFSYYSDCSRIAERKVAEVMDE